MKSFFSADPFAGHSLGRAQVSQSTGCVLIGTETHPSDYETLFQRTIEKYQGSGWSIVRHETGRVFYAGTADETIEANIWACPPGIEVAGADAEGGYSLGAGRRGAHLRRRRGVPPVLFPTSPSDYGQPGLMPTSPMPHALEGRQVPVRMGQVPGHPDLHWGVYNGMYVRWPHCDPRWDAQCPYPTSVIVEQPGAGLGQVGPVSGFGGPGGGGFGFTGGPGGMVGPVAGTPSPASGPVTGPSIPCGPAGGPSCPPMPGPTTVIQNVYPVRNLGGPSDVAHGRDNWYHPMSPCPPGYFRSSPGSPCVKEGDIVDYGEGYFQRSPMAF